MKKIILITLFILIVSVSYADMVKIPFSCWPKDLQEEFKQVGRKLDLSASDREVDSWGYVVSEGSNYIIYSYKSLTPSDFDVIRDIVFKVELKERD